MEVGDKAVVTLESSCVLGCVHMKHLRLLRRDGKQERITK